MKKEKKKTKRLILGVTGQIGAGKTVVSTLLSNLLPARLLELDSFIHNLYFEEEVRKFLQSNFPENIFLPDGSVNRKKLGKIVFSSPKKLKLLNSFFDHLVYLKLKDIFSKFEDDNFIVDGAILLQNSWHTLLDKIILVKAPFSAKKRRAALRLNLSEEEIEKRLQIQLTEEEMEKEADFIIENDGDLELLKKKVERLCVEIKNI